eukprot:14919-Heterococcus_DN1.PRE.4
MHYGASYGFSGPATMCMSAVSFTCKSFNICAVRTRYRAQSCASCIAVLASSTTDSSVHDSVAVQ